MKKLYIFLYGFILLASSVAAQNQVTEVCENEDVYFHINTPTAADVQWQESQDGISYTNIAGETQDTLFLPSVSSSAWYRALIFDDDCDGFPSDVQELLVNPLAQLSLQGLDSAYCLGDDSVSFSVSPQGATLSGVGVAGNFFVPQLADTGTHTLTLSYTDSNNCTADSSIIVTVNPLPEPVLTIASSQFCEVDSFSIPLVGSPQGGVFSGPGVSGSDLETWNMPVGSNAIVYTYTNALGCEGSDTVMINVNELPSQSFAGADTSTSDTVVTLNAQAPAAGTGTWSVHTGAGGSFANVNDPQTAFTGQQGETYELIWTVANPPCNSTTDTVIVEIQGPPLPSIACNGTLYIHPTDNFGPISWGCQGIVTGATDDNNGQSNTALIVSNCTPPTAANICDTLTAFGFNDWYLPAYDELDCMRQNAAQIGGFSIDAYWSSTEGAGILSSNARMRTFPSGMSGVSSKTNTHRVRCVRRQ